MGTKVNLTFQGLRLFSESELQFPVQVSYDIAKNLMIYVLQSIFNEMKKVFYGGRVLGKQ